MTSNMKIKLDSDLEWWNYLLHFEGLKSPPLQQMYLKSYISFNWIQQTKSESKIYIFTSYLLITGQVSREVHNFELKVYPIGKSIICKYW